MAVDGLAGAAVAVAVGSPGEAMGTSKDVVAVKVKPTPMAPPLVRCAPRAKAVVRSAGRPGAAADIAMNSCATVTRGVTTSMVPHIRHREVRLDPVGVVCPDIALVANTTSVS